MSSVSSLAVASFGENKSSYHPLTCDDGRKPNILLAEDSAAARILTAAMLGHIGCNVDAVEDGEEAVRLVGDGNYDLIILDIEMPVMDGVVAASKIRTLGGSASQTPIMALSAFLADTKKSSFWKENFDLTLAKPAGKQQLHEAIGEILQTGICSKGDCQDVQPSCSGDVHQLVDLVEFEKISMGISSADWSGIVDTTISELGGLSNSLVLSLPGDKREWLRSAAHRIKGIGATFACPRLHHLAQRVEKQALSTAGQELDERVEALKTCITDTIAELKGAVKTT